MPLMDCSVCNEARSMREMMVCSCCQKFVCSECVDQTTGKCQICFSSEYD